MDPFNLAAGIYQELRQDERIRGGMEYGEADYVTAFDQNDLRRELRVPTFPEWKDKEGNRQNMRGGWWDWDPKEKKWVPEADPDAGYPPEGKILAAAWNAQQGEKGFYVQYIQGGSNAEVIDADIKLHGFGKIDPPSPERFPPPSERKK